jgi:glycosyltransferase involved in cell wall biosynthesis
MAVASVVSFIDCGIHPWQGLNHHKDQRNSSVKTTVPTTARSKRACNDVAVRTPLAAPTSRPQEHARRTAEGPVDGASSPPSARRLLVVSHPAVVSVNQEVYRELAHRGWDVTIVLPRRWRHEFSDRATAPQCLAGLESALRPTRVALSGHPQRHLYLTSARRRCGRARPDVAFVEAEPFAFSAAQWGRAFTKLNIPFGVQCAENIDRSLPRPVRWLRSSVLRHAAFVAARSDSAARLARAWGARGEVGLVPHAVPNWQSVPPVTERPFTVGYAGRLVPSKGLMDLLAAVRQLDAPVQLLLIGDGEQRGELEGQEIPGSTVKILDDLGHDEMAAGYAQLDVLVLPSHTTTTWKEQFGRVIVEALWCGVPVVGSDSGEIPWLIGLTGGGLVFAEGDAEMLAAQLARLRASPELREQLASKGRATVESLFSVSAATTPLERMLIQAAASRKKASR